MKYASNMNMSRKKRCKIVKNGDLIAFLFRFGVFLMETYQMRNISPDTDGTLWRGRVIALFATACRNKIRERSGPGRKSEHTGYVQEPRKVILQIQ